MKSLIAVTFVMAVVSAVPSGHSGHLQHISVPNYNPTLEFLGQHVDLPKIPTKIVRITKTVAIKVPVPYPVKVPHHVPYPVPVSKPYPVPVTKIVKVPEPVPVPVHSGGQGGSAGLNFAYSGLSQGYGGSGHGGDSQGYSGAVSSPNYEISEPNSHDFGVQGGYDAGYGGDHGYSGSQQYGASNQVFIPGPSAGNAGYDQHQGASVTVSHQEAMPSGSAGYYQNYQAQQPSGYHSH